MANRTHVCKYCKKRSEEAKKFGLSYFCDSDCAMKYSIDKSRKDKVEQDRKEHREAKQRLRDNDKRFRTKEAQKAFNAFIRERDKDLPCISCGQFVSENAVGGTYDCGHYKTVGGFPELRFEELNANKQCKSCNGGAGNFSKKDTTVTKEYRENLIRKIGLGKVEWLEGPHEPKKYTCADLKEIELHYKAKLKELKRHCQND